MSNKVNEDGTRSVTYKLSEPENGFAVFTMDRDGNLLSFQVYVTGDK